MDLSDVTIVILSYHRQHCLKQSLRFYQDTTLQILVLDNSPIPLEEQFIPFNCSYVHSQTNFANRAKLAASLIRTKYTIVGADDEIYLPSSLGVMRQFLESDNSYVAVGGSALAIWRYGNYIAGSWAYRSTFNYHNDEKTPLDRIKKHTGGGDAPLTSFFTSNLTKSEFAKICLNSYGDAPVIATDAISVLTICGGGKSKYLNLLYWIRNWNQSPRSHKGWNRNEPLHEWWSNPNNDSAREQFAEQLKKAFSKFGDPNTFNESWQLILKSDSALPSKVSQLFVLSKRLVENRFSVWLKFIIKSFFAPSKLPATFTKELEIMAQKGIYLNIDETNRAVNIVSGQIPYKNW